MLIESAPLRQKSDQNNLGKKHYKLPEEHPFMLDQLKDTTVLLGGITPVHDYLIEGGLQGLGFKCKALPNTTLAAFQVGRENGNNGYCNPTYFSSGNLIKYLQNLEDKGMDRKEIIEKYVFLTAGCNAPCRFGMIEDQYRLVLRNTGFEGFRVIVFQKSGGMKQEVKGNAIDINIRFFLAIVNAIHLGDLVNELTCRIRPYEVVEGSTNAIKEESLEYLHAMLKNKKSFRLTGIWKRMGAATGLTRSVEFMTVLLDQVMSKYYVRALKEVSRKFATIEVDHLRMKTKVKMTGEFWAMTTQSEGNYNMVRFLEEEGAEVLPEPVATFLLYMFSKHILRLKDRKGIAFPSWSKPIKRLLASINYYKKYWTLTLGQKLYQREYTRLLQASGGPLHDLVDPSTLQQLADPYYNIRIEGGEGFMEVAKTIYYHQKHLCHMVLSLKPFGCMPSTISDGVQVAVTEHYKDVIFIPIETSGEGEINAHSRVQMTLSDGRQKAKEEFDAALDNCGKTLEELKLFVNSNPLLKNSLYKIPHKAGIIGTAANFIFQVNELMDLKSK